jgi:hypothetical protein
MFKNGGLKKRLSENHQIPNSLGGTSQEDEIQQISDIKGIRNWLLLYRPEGMDGWIVHSLFYLCALSAMVLKVRGVMTVVGGLQGSSAWLAPIYFTSASLFVMLTFRLRDVSLRPARRSDHGFANSGDSSEPSY